MSPNGQDSYLIGVGPNVKASVRHIWSTLTDAKSWPTWWPDGAPEAGDEPWTVGRDLLFAGARTPDSARATIRTFDPPAADAADSGGVGAATLAFGSAEVDYTFRIDAVLRGCRRSC